MPFCIAGPPGAAGFCPQAKAASPRDSIMISAATIIVLFNMARVLYPSYLTLHYSFKKNISHDIVPREKRSIFIKNRTSLKMKSCLSWLLASGYS